MVMILGMVLSVVLNAQPAPTHKASDVELIANWVCGKDPAEAFAKPFKDREFLAASKDTLLYTDISGVEPPVGMKAVTESEAAHPPITLSFPNSCLGTDTGETSFRVGAARPAPKREFRRGASQTGVLGTREVGGSSQRIAAVYGYFLSRNESGPVGR